MELGLILPFPDSPQTSNGTDLGFCMAVGKVVRENQSTITTSSDPPVQLHLLPSSPPVHTNNLAQNLLSKAKEGPSSHSSPNRTISSFQMEVFNLRSKRNFDEFRVNDDGYGSSSRKRLRLSRQQSAFLEDSFKEHPSLNHKEKLALAKRLNLRPRQVEVWFQNRRARTKLKQNEVDCEYLKRGCERLREENRRLQKEIQELRALNSSKPFYMHLPPTTLTMCSSCATTAAVVAPTP